MITQTKKKWYGYLSNIFVRIKVHLIPLYTGCIPHLKMFCFLLITCLLGIALQRRYNMLKSPLTSPPLVLTVIYYNVSVASNHHQLHFSYIRHIGRNTFMSKIKCLVFWSCAKVIISECNYVIGIQILVVGFRNRCLYLYYIILVSGLEPRLVVLSFRLFVHTKLLSINCQQFNHLKMSEMSVDETSEERNNETQIHSGNQDDKSSDN